MLEWDNQHGPVSAEAERRPVKQASPAEAQHRRILDAAVAEFSWDGYMGTTISTIAETAGISHGLVHHYFASKADLFTTALADGLGYMEQVRRRTLNGAGLPEDRLRCWAQGMATALSAAFLHSRLVMQVLGAPGIHPPPSLEVLTRFAATEVAALTTVLTERGQAPGTAAMTAGLAFSTLVGSRLAGTWYAGAAGVDADGCVNALYREVCAILGIAVQPCALPVSLPAVPWDLNVGDTPWARILCPQDEPGL